MRGPDIGNFEFPFVTYAGHSTPAGQIREAEIQHKAAPAAECPCRTSKPTESMCDSEVALTIVGAEITLMLSLEPIP
jgi:hypothetical protein